MGSFEKSNDGEGGGDIVGGRLVYETWLARCEEQMESPRPSYICFLYYGTQELIQVNMFMREEKSDTF